MHIPRVRLFYWRQYNCLMLGLPFIYVSISQSINLPNLYSHLSYKCDSGWRLIKHTVVCKLCLLYDIKLCLIYIASIYSCNHIDR